MAIRKTTHILKNTGANSTPSQLPSSGVQMGEPLVNLYDGILYFSGNPASTSFTNLSGNTGYFEVGSNLYDLKLRNKITQYQGESGGNLVGKFLSGTTNGFVLADITSIAASTDSYTTGATWSFTTPNELVLNLNQGKPSVPVIIDTFSNVNLYGTTNVNGNLTVTGTSSLQGVTATNVNANNLYASNTLSAVTGNITTLNTTTGNITTVNANNVNVTGTEVVNNLTITGTGLYNTTSTGTNPFEIVNYTSLTAFSQTKEVYVTGLTLSQSATTSNNNQTYNLTYRGTPLETTNYTITVKDTFVTGGTYDTSNGTITFVKNDSTSFQVTGIDGMDTFVTGGTSTGSTLSSPNATIELTYNRDVVNNTYRLDYKDTFVTGGTYNAGTITFGYNDSGRTAFTVTGIDGTDTYVTGFTWTPSTNTLLIKQNQGETDLPVYINSFSGLSVSNLDSGQVVYVGSSGQLKTDTIGEFTYNDSNNTLTVGNLQVNNPSGTTAIIGQGGLIIGSGGSTSNPGIGDLVVHGNFVVYGSGTTIATNELYVEDPTITLNYNPSGSSTTTSIGSGIVIQDGSGIVGTNSTLQIGQLYLNGNLNPNTEYNALTGNANRGLFTQLNDILIRNTDNNSGAPNGKRVLAEDDILDGGTY